MCTWYEEICVSGTAWPVSSIWHCRPQNSVLAAVKPDRSDRHCLSMGRFIPERQTSVCFNMWWEISAPGPSFWCATVLGSGTNFLHHIYSANRRYRLQVQNSLYVDNMQWYFAFDNEDVVSKKNAQTQMQFLWVAKPETWVWPPTQILLWISISWPFANRSISRCSASAVSRNTWPVMLQKTAIHLLVASKINYCKSLLSGLLKY